MFKTNTILHVLPTRECHKRVPISVGTLITDLGINYLDSSDFENASMGLESSLLYYTNEKAGAVTATPRRNWED